MTGRRARKVEIVEPDEQTRRALARRHPEVIGQHSVFVVVTAPDEHDRVAGALGQIAHAVNEGERLRLERLIDALSPAVDVPTPPVLEQARQEALLRSRLLSEFGACTAQQLAELSGSTAANRSQLAYAWRKEGRIFAVTHRGTPWYLGFQFDDDGRPLPVIADVLAALRGWPEWEIAAWFVRENGVLDRRRPVDVLRTNPAAVVRAAAFDGDRVDTRPRGGRSRVG